MRIGALLVVAGALLSIAAAPAAASDEAGAIWCKEPTVIGIGEREIRTPEICIPGP